MAYTKKKYTKPEPVQRRCFTPAFPASPEQEPILDRWIQGDDNMGIDAGPGSGKSTTLKWLMSLAYKDIVMSSQSAAMLAFSKAIVTEIEPECAPNVNVSTAHSFGYKSMSKKFGRLFVNGGKQKKIFTDLWPHRDPSEADDEERGAAYSFMFDFLKLIDMLKVNLRDETNGDDVMQTIMQYGIELDLTDELMSMLQAQFKASLGQTSFIDFVDMIWMPIRLGLQIPQFDVVYVDERQDLNSMMIEYLFRMTKERIVHVGDQNQCQPKGTMVMKKDGSLIPIEKIKVGDRVVAYHPSKAYVAPEVRVNETACRPFFGDLTVVKAGEKISKSTPNHKWYVKWDDSALDKHCVYLMLKDNQFRIGKSKLFYESKQSNNRNRKGTFNFGPTVRSNAEQADAYWILAIVDTASEALVKENLYSFKFGIPQVRFKDGANSSELDQDALDKFWEEFGDNYQCGVNLLEYLDMDISLPFRDKILDTFHCGFNNTFFCYACNLFECMMVPVFNTYSPNERNVSKRWKKITLEKEHYHGMVYSLDVNEFHTYVSDGILTGNSIFSFAGADTHSTQRLIQKFGGQQLPLKVCYRCGTDIVKFAQEVYPDGILPFDKNHQGVVEEVQDIDYTMPDGSMILSRRNANLVRPCFKLLREGRKAIIKGKDIGAGLLKIVRSVKAANTIDLIDRVQLHQEKRVEKLLKQKGVTQAMIEKIEDECQCIIEIAHGCGSTVKEVEDRIEKLFDENTNGITLSSCHRSKGLEADMVTIIDFDRIRLSHDKMSKEDHIQEKNLDFVARTRAKKVLHLVRGTTKAK